MEANHCVGVMNGSLDDMPKKTGSRAQSHGVVLGRLGKPLPVVERVARVMAAKRIRKEEAKVVKKRSTNGQVFRADFCGIGAGTKTSPFPVRYWGAVPGSSENRAVEVARG